MCLSVRLNVCCLCVGEYVECEHSCEEAADINISAFTVNPSDRMQQQN